MKFVCVCGEPIHVEGWSIALDGRETHREVFEERIGLQIVLRDKDIALRDFCDADWAGSANDQHTTTRYMFFLVGVGVISWKCKKQPTIA